MIAEDWTPSATARNGDAFFYWCFKCWNSTYEESCMMHSLNGLNFTFHNGEARPDVDAADRAFVRFC